MNWLKLQDQRWMPPFSYKNATRTAYPLSSGGLTPVDVARQTAGHANGKLQIWTNLVRWHRKLQSHGPEHRQQQGPHLELRQAFSKALARARVEDWKAVGRGRLRHLQPALRPEVFRIIAPDLGGAAHGVGREGH